MILDIKERTKVLGFVITIIMTLIAIYVIGALILHSTLLTESQNQPVYHQVSINTVLISIIIFGVAYKCTQFASILHFVYTAESHGLPNKTTKFLIKFLSIVPTPLLIALLFPFTFDYTNNIYLSLFLITVTLVVCAVPTASQIALDGLSSHSKQAYEAAIGLGLSKSFTLLHVVAVENKKLFQTATTVGVMRVIVENWILIATSAGLSVYEIINSNNLPSILEKSYSNITSKVGIIYIVILLALTFFGKVWSALVAGIVKQ